MAKRETLKQAGYRFIRSIGNKTYLLHNISDNKAEVWFANKNHASYGLRWRNTDLEFARTATTQDLNTF